MTMLGIGGSVGRRSVYPLASSPLQKTHSYVASKSRQVSGNEDSAACTDDGDSSHSAHLPYKALCSLRDADVVVILTRQWADSYSVLCRDEEGQVAISHDHLLDISRALAQDALVSSMSDLFPRLTILLLMTCEYLQSHIPSASGDGNGEGYLASPSHIQMGMDSYEESVLEEICLFLVALCDMLLGLLTSHADSLKSLLRSDGEAAFQYLLHIQPNMLRILYQALRRAEACLSCPLNEAVEEARACIALLVGSLDSFTELNLLFDAMQYLQ